MSDTAWRELEDTFNALLTPATKGASMTDVTAFEGWAILELMGHRVRPGYVREVEIAGGKMLRIDIPLPPDAMGEPVTEFYGASAIYALRPVAEEIARAEISRWSDPRPVRPAVYRPETKAVTHDDHDHDEED